MAYPGLKAYDPHRLRWPGHGSSKRLFGSVWSLNGRHILSDTNLVSIVGVSLGAFRPAMYTWASECFVTLCYFVIDA